MKSMKNLVLVIAASLPMIGNAYEQLMYPYYKKLVTEINERDETKVIIDEERDQREIWNLERTSKTIEEMKTKLWQYLQSEKGKVLNPATDFDGLGKVEEKRAEVQVQEQEQEQKTESLVIETLTFSDLLAKLRNKVNTDKDAKRVFLQRERHFQDNHAPVCAKAKKEEAKERLTGDVLVEIRDAHPNVGQLLSPEDDRDLKFFVNSLYGEVCPQKKKVVKREFKKEDKDRGPVMKIQAEKVEVAEEPAKLDTETRACDLSVASKMIKGRAEADLKNTLAVLYKEAAQHTALHPKEDDRLRLYIFNYLINNQSYIGTPNEPAIACIAELAKAEGTAVNNKEVDVNRSARFKLESQSAK